MGKAARMACIFTPMALTIASFVCLILVEISGSNTHMLSDLYFFEANLTNLTVSSTTSNDVLSAAIDVVKSDGDISDIYQVHLWNYCNGTSNATLSECSKRKSEFVFDPLTVWGLSISNSSTATSTSSSDSALESAISSAKSDIEAYEDDLLGDSATKALKAYAKVAKWMFIAYQASFWTTLATIVVGVLAIFSRWGSLLTWILAFASSFFTLAAVLTSTVLFSALVTALNKALKDYGIKLTLGHPALVVCWLGVIFSWSATFFWLFSVCCCSGKSNPHHRSNKGGLWDAEPKGQGYGGGLKVEKTGGDYERVASPYIGGQHDDQVPLHDYGAQPAGFDNYPQAAAYEPYRHH